MTYNIDLYAFSDTAILRNIADFVKQTRLFQNKTQQQLADEAGINRSTLAQLEKGNNFSVITLIEVLRSLGELNRLQDLKYEPLISPLKLAEIEMAKTYRARPKKKQSIKKTLKSNW